ncbi:hypothetical protein HMPREF1511_0078 [Streptococcus sp. CM7]|nr:hypothetical protein HMPREF1511_0078 [Streptococcus sp. CM7]
MQEADNILDYLVEKIVVIQYGKEFFYERFCKIDKDKRWRYSKRFNQIKSSF